MKTVDRHWWANVGLAAAYVIVAELGLLLALPSTNATPVWFPAGLALGAILKSIRQQPDQLGSLTKTIMGFAKAYRALIKGSKQAGPYLGFDLR